MIDAGVGSRRAVTGLWKRSDRSRKLRQLKMKLHPDRARQNGLTPDEAHAAFIWLTQIFQGNENVTPLPFDRPGYRIPAKRYQTPRTPSPPPLPPRRVPSPVHHGPSPSTHVHRSPRRSNQTAALGGTRSARASRSKSSPPPRVDASASASRGMPPPKSQWESEPHHQQAEGMPSASQAEATGERQEEPAQPASEADGARTHALPGVETGKAAAAALAGAVFMRVLGPWLKTVVLRSCAALIHFAMVGGVACRCIVMCLLAIPWIFTAALAWTSARVVGAALAVTAAARQAALALWQELAELSVCDQGRRALRAIARKVHLLRVRLFAPADEYERALAHAAEVDPSPRARALEAARTRFHDSLALSSLSALAGVAVSESSQLWAPVNGLYLAVCAVSLAGAVRPDALRAVAPGAGTLRAMLGTPAEPEAAPWLSLASSFGHTGLKAKPSLQPPQHWPRIVMSSAASVADQGAPSRWSSGWGPSGGWLAPFVGASAPAADGVEVSGAGWVPQAWAAAARSTWGLAAPPPPPVHHHFESRDEVTALVLALAFVSALASVLVYYRGGMRAWGWGVRLGSFLRKVPLNPSPN